MCVNHHFFNAFLGTKNIHMESIQIELIKDEESKLLFLKWLKDKYDEILKNHISEEDLVCFLREFFDFANGPKPSEIDEDNWENM